MSDRVIRQEEIEKITNEDDLFVFVEYSPEAAERIGYSDYSYWKSVFQHFLKKKSAVVQSCIFIALVIFSFIALAIGKYNYAKLIPDLNSHLSARTASTGLAQTT